MELSILSILFCWPSAELVILVELNIFSLCEIMIYNDHDKIRMNFTDKNDNKLGSCAISVCVFLSGIPRLSHRKI